MDLLCLRRIVALWNSSHSLGTLTIEYSCFRSCEFLLCYFCNLYVSMSLTLISWSNGLTTSTCIFDKYFCVSCSLILAFISFYSLCFFCFSSLISSFAIYAFASMKSLSKVFVLLPPSKTMMYHWTISNSSISYSTCVCNKEFSSTKRGYFLSRCTKYTINQLLMTLHNIRKVKTNERTLGQNHLTYQFDLFGG